MRWHPVILVALLAGCASQQAQHVRAWAPGHTLAELEQCAGKPTAADALADGSSIAQWDYAEPNSTASAPVLVGVAADLVDMAMAPVAPLALLAGAGSPSVSMSTAGACHAIATVRDGRVTQLRYSGPNGGLSGPDAVCAPIMRECLP